MVIQTLKIEIEGKEYTVTGSDFYSMLAQVKAVEGRKWDGNRRLWILPGAIDEVRAALPELQILGDEDEVLNAEIAEIQKFQKWISEDEKKVAAKRDELVAKRNSYSYGSKSRIKLAIATDAACLDHAIDSAKMPVEKLTEVQIRGMKRACVIMGWM